MLQLVDRKALWVPTGDLGAQVTGATHRYMLNTSNALTDDADSLPTATLHTIATNGADALMIVCGTKIATVTGNRALSAMTVYTGAWGLPFGTSDIDPLSAVPSHRGDTAITSTLTRAYGLAVFPTDPTVQSPNALTDMTLNSATSLIWVNDTTNVAANDYVLAAWWIGRRTNNLSASAGTNTTISNEEPRITGVETVKWSVGYTMTLGAGGGTDITAFTVTGGMYALLFKEITLTEEVPKSTLTRRDLRMTSVPVAP